MKYVFFDWKRRGKFFIDEPYSYRYNRQWYGELLDKVKPKTLLDVGCGFGLFFDLYKEKNIPFVVGLDFSITQLEHAKKKAKECGFILIQASASHIPLRSEIFDLSLTHTVLQHIPYDYIEACVREMTRVTKKWIFIDEYARTPEQDLRDLQGHNIYVHDYLRLFSRMETIDKEVIRHTRRLLLRKKVGKKMRILAVCRWGFDPLSRPIFYYWHREPDVDVLLYLHDESYRLNVPGASDLKTPPFIIGDWTEPLIVNLANLKRVLDFYKPDIIYHGYETYRSQALTRATLFRKWGVKQVWAVSQNLLTVPSNPEEKEMERKTIPIVDGFIACSTSVKERYEALGAKNVVVGPVGGVNEEVFRPAIDENERKMLKTKHAIPDGFNIFYAGRIVEEKGIQIVLYAMRDLFQEQPALSNKVYFTIVGSPRPWAEKLIKLIKHVGLDKNVRYLGRIEKHEHVAEMERCMDVFVYPSLPLEGWIEQLGLSAVEASSSGLPCIVSDIGGLKDVVDPETGFLIRPGNVGQMKTALLTLIENPELRKEMGKKGREKMLKKYSFKVIAKEQLEFMRKLLT